MSPHKVATLSPTKSHALAETLAETRSPLKRPTLPPMSAPEGWNIEPSTFLSQDDWDDCNSEGHVVARCYGLEGGRSVMEDHNGFTTIFESGDKLYLWARLNNEVYEMKARNLRDLIVAMSEPGGEGIRMQPLAPLDYVPC
ncbi:hypothetical protein N7456_006772 [Penicillium angulare]|uniref:Uncharacterized protein n=1 Tax=Penicillium angulare TaxID=116970 RepID=A0A9W9FIF0_9EURO|nr:hypothetical protein N7456_006772 [Penicillium angulare]